MICYQKKITISKKEIPLKKISFLFLFFCVSCTSNQKVISSSKKITEGINNTSKGLKIVRENANSTYAYITLTESERPHVHDHNDVTAYILKDGATLHFHDKDVPLKAGQLIMIPKKTKHNVSFPKGMIAEAFLIISPKIGKDFKRYIK